MDITSPLGPRGRLADVVKAVERRRTSRGSARGEGDLAARLGFGWRYAVRGGVLARRLPSPRSW
jgi:hypothetical protein